jgi:hypothetical protein
LILYGNGETKFRKNVFKSRRLENCAPISQLSHFDDCDRNSGSLFFKTSRSVRLNMSQRDVNVTQPSALLALLKNPVWFCLKAQPKRELASIALPQDDPQGASLVRRSDVSRLSVREICVFETTSRC